MATVTADAASGALAQPVHSNIDVPGFAPDDLLRSRRRLACGRQGRG
jgi:hypothetical protein